MTLLASVRKSIDYIEANLQNDIGVCDVSGAVCYSQFYFSRQFSAYAHTSIYDYILKRKLSESYKLLFTEKPRIIGLALQYGFSSPEVYTRAFRKMFGENPSEAAVFKPLLIYEPIDESYLDFLVALKVEIIDMPAADCFFEPDGGGAGASALILLSGDLLGVKCVLGGRVIDSESSRLSMKLSGLKTRIRLHHTDTRHSQRYFFDNFYDASSMTSNFILLKDYGSFIDVVAPE